MYLFTFLSFTWIAFELTCHGIQHLDNVSKNERKRENPRDCSDIQVWYECKDFTILQQLALFLTIILRPKRKYSKRNRFPTTSNHLLDHCWSVCFFFGTLIPCVCLLFDCWVKWWCFGFWVDSFHVVTSLFSEFGGFRSLDLSVKLQVHWV